jgi:ankyrin repeat protein
MLDAVDDAKRCPELWRACKNGFFTDALNLLEAGADIEERGGRYNMTPLMVASLRYRPTIVELLLDWNADISAHDLRGLRAWHLATAEGHVPILNLLATRCQDFDDVPQKPHPSCKSGNRPWALIRASGMTMFEGE